MDNITKYLNRIAYKFPKGYPDMNNDQDVLLLETFISEVIGEKFKLNELTVSPKYQSRGVFNPFYVVDDSVDKQVRDLLNDKDITFNNVIYKACLLYTSPSPRDRQKSRMPSSA